ncbi:hypothetical protein C8A06_1121 [Microbacteriaceae bacterium MWH-Ta3]|nr:hypothetical protein C8A06_1121 [Microbacteriaceae bacterium MWH-Ta3]
MVSMLLVVVVLGVLQVAAVGLIRTIVADAAAGGAAYAALADVPDSHGVLRARELLDASLGSDVADAARIVTRPGGGAGLVALDITTDLPVIGLWGIPGALTVTGRAVREVLP